MTRKIASVKYKGESYQLIAAGVNAGKFVDPETNKMVQNSAWRLLTVVKDDKRTRQTVRKFSKEQLNNFAFAIFGLLVSLMISFGLFKLSSIAEESNSTSLLVLGSIALVVIVFSSIIICVMLIAAIITGSELIAGRIGSLGTRYVKHNIYDSINLGTTSKKDLRKASKKELNQYSLIDWNNHSYENDYKTDLSRLQSFIKTLSADELTDFIVKGYEHGVISADSERIQQILNNNDGKMSEFLMQEASDAIKENKLELEKFDSLREKYENTFDEYCAKQMKIEAEKAKAKEESTAGKTSDEELLEILSNRNAV